MQSISSLAELESALSESFDHTVVLFKHSTRCSISAMALNRLKDNVAEYDFRIIDVIQSRPVSNAVAEQLDVHHESPQLIIIQNGKCSFDASHLEITLDELKEQADHRVS
jgi:bacillithiol system protein YtxJ